MKKQQCQWLFKVFSKTYSYNNNICRPFCSATTNTSNLHMLLEKKLPLLIVTYDHKSGGADGGDCSKKERRPGSSVCDDTLGFMSLFHGDVNINDDDELKLKKKKKEEVYKVYLPEIADRRICGSSEGWLVTVHDNTEVQLLNPISRVVVHLPSLITAFPEVVGKVILEENKGLCYLVLEEVERCGSGQSFDAYDPHHFRELFLHKVVTNTTTTTDADVVVMAIYGIDNRLAFCRPSSTAGNGIDDDDDDDGSTDKQKYNKWICFYGEDNYADVTFYKGNFYAVNYYGDVFVVKGLDGSSPLVEMIIETKYDDRIVKYLVESSWPEYDHQSLSYLVEMESSSSSSSGGDGDLLKVIRCLEKKVVDHYRTIGFRVIKLDFINGLGEDVTDLGEDCALFIGYNRSFSFSASKFPGCRGNCIYFTDHYFNV